jgi:DNA uptake protein ComE-like DNA-binding protein
MNINKASQSELEMLPGIDAAAARRIIAGRPYQTSMELMRRHVISRAEYNKIASKVVAR